MVPTVRVTGLLLLALLRVIEAGEAVHDGAGCALVEIAQVKLTLPVKPFAPVRVVAKVAEAPALTFTEAGLGVESEKLAAGVTVTATVL